MLSLFTLGSGDQKQIFDKVKRVAAQWQKFGAFLNVPAYQLENIRNQDNKLHLVVTRFFQCTDCTWRKVVEAIYSDNPRHAKKIAEEHPSKYNE